MNPHYRSVAQRANHRCEYCHAPEAVFNLPFEVEHIVPPSRGGTDDAGGLALACRACNVFKSDHIEAEDTQTLATVRLCDPRRDVWSEHFQVDVESGSIVGITAIGRATVSRLNMNSDAQRDARLSWIRLGLFP